MSSPKISFIGVAKEYGEVKALRDVDLDVRDGEFLTLLGPSGSGKTTLLMLLAGLIEPDRGDIRVDGSLSTHLPPYERDIGLVFQNYALFPHLTVFENVAFPLRMRRVNDAEIRRRVHAMLDVVRLPHVAERLPRELSGGQQQRIAFARCAVYEPSVILMDEPLGALDKKLRDQMQLEIKRLHDTLGVTILYVTHDQEEAMAMSDRICLMNDGGIEQLGTPEDLYFRPRTIFAADFLGNSNIYPAVLKERAGDEWRLAGPHGAVVRAAASDVDAGDPISFMVRPEHVAVLTEGAEAQNCVEATLERAIVTGPLTRLLCHLDDGQPIVAATLTASPARPKAGTRLRLGWPAERTVVLSSRRPGQ